MNAQNEQNLIRSPMLWLLMAASLVLPLALAPVLNIRFDEAFTLDTTSRDVAYAIRQALTFEQQAPLYFVVLTIWRNLDSSIFFARLFSILCLPLFVWITAATAQRYVKSVNPLLIAAVAAVHQQVVWSALDIRLYSLMLVMSGLLMLLFYDGFLSERPSRRAQVLYTVAAILALYTQYYLGFQLVAGAAALVVLKKWKPLYRYLAAMFVTGVAFSPMLLAFSQQFSEVSSHTEDALSVMQLAKGIYQRTMPLFVSTDWIEPEALKRWLARILALAISALFGWKLLNRREPADVALAVMLVVLTGFHLAAYALLGEQGIQHRHMSAMILPLLLGGFSAAAVFQRRRAVYIWLALLLFLNAGYLYFAYLPLAKPGDFVRVAEFVMANEAENQPIIVFHADAVLPLEYYYHGKNKLIALPQRTNFEAWDPRQNVLKDEAQIVNIINQQAAGAERIWLVNDGWCRYGTLPFNCQILENVVGKYFEVEKSQAFYDPVTVRLLRRKAL